MPMCKRYKSVTASAAMLRDVYGPNAAKKIARRFGVAVITAKVWLAGRFPEHRTRELALAVRDELDRIDRRNAEIRRQLEQAESDRGIGEARDEAAGRGSVGLAVKDRAEAHRVGR